MNELTFGPANEKDYIDSLERTLRYGGLDHEVIVMN